MNDKKYVFAPGRLCLIGEHSDWASNYKKINSNIENGMAIIITLDEGIYATINLSDYIKIDGINGSIFKNIEAIKKPKNFGEYWKYALGACKYMIENYKVKGIEINIYKNTLSMKKGLASSAAICCLVVDSYNKLYNLNLTEEEIVTAAYNSEILIGSPCGKLDQIYISHPKVQLATFKSGNVIREKINVKENLYMVYADLKSSKNTIKILSDLNKCYPNYKNQKEKLVHEFLGKENKKFCLLAKKYIETGCVSKLGLLMNEYQLKFDEVLIPFSDELKAPILHHVFNDKYIKSLTYGAKGCGSGGDGAVQFLAKDKYCQEKLVNYLKNELKYNPTKITIKSNTIKTAIIPIGGYGVRMYPMTKIIGKEFLPLMDSDKRIKPAIIILLKELIDAGIEKIGLVLPKKYQENYIKLFTKNFDYQKFDSIENELQEIYSKITFIDDDNQKGLSNAINLCKDFIKDDKFIIVLGDQIYKTNSDVSCIKQIINFHNKTNRCLIPVCETKLKDTINYGILKGTSVLNNNYFEIKKFVEKPTVEISRKFLYTNKGGKRKYYSVFGCYLLDDKFLKLLDINREFNENLKEYIELYKPLAFIPNGKYYDIGNNKSYCKTFIEFIGE